MHHISVLIISDFLRQKNKKTVSSISCLSYVTFVCDSKVGFFSSKEVVIDAVRSSPSSKNDGGVFAHKNADEYDDDFKKEDDYLEVKELMTGANASLRFANDLRAAITQEVAASSGRWNPSNKDVLIPPPLSASQETGFFALKDIGKALNERKAK